MSLDGKRSKNLSLFINHLDRGKTNLHDYTRLGICSTVGIRLFEDLPLKAQEYILYLEKKLNVPIRHISTGPKRNDIIIR